MANNEKVVQFLEKAQIFYLTTVDGSKPKCRPISFSMEHDGKIYFGVGTYKNVYRQLQENPNTEVCAFTGQNFLRYYGKAEFDPNPELVEKALDAVPVLRDVYNEQTGYKLGMFYLTDATAEICGMMGVEETISM